MLDFNTECKCDTKIQGLHYKALTLIYYYIRTQLRQEVIKTTIAVLVKRWSF